MVLATNRPADLDPAVVDRIDEMIEFPLPSLEETPNPNPNPDVKSDLAWCDSTPQDTPALTLINGILKERQKLVKLYFNKLLGPAKQAQGIQIELDGIGDEHIERVAAMADGLSGRAISKLMASVQGHVYSKTLRGRAHESGRCQARAVPQVRTCGCSTSKRATLPRNDTG